MLSRTDWILLFLGADAGPYSSDQVRVMKGMFLLDQIPSLPLGGQYHFEPYEGSGPTDPMVYRDLDALQLAGLVSVQRSLGSTRKTYELTDQGRQRFAELRSRVLPTQYEEIEAIKRRVTSQSIDDLLEQIYLEFPDYAFRNVARMANWTGSGP